MLKKYLRAVLGLKDKVIHKYLLLGWIVPPPRQKKIWSPNPQYLRMQLYLTIVTDKN